MPELQEERDAREEKKDLTEFKETEPVQKSGWVLVLSLEEIENICLREHPKTGLGGIRTCS